MKELLLYLLVCLMLPAIAKAETLYPAKADNGQWGYINAETEWIIAPQFDGTNGFRGDYAAAWMIPEEAKLSDWSDYDWLDYDCMGVIDRAGNWVLTPEYSLSSGQSGDWFGGKDEGIWLVNQWERSDMMGFFDIPSGTVSGVKWYEVWHWCSDSRLIPVIDGENYTSGYADRSTGEMVIPCQYNGWGPANFNDGVATVAGEDGEGNQTTPWQLINEQGETIPLPEGYQSDYANDFSCGRIAVVSPEGLWGYADREGKITIPAQFGYAYQFSEGFAEVTFLEGVLRLAAKGEHVVIRLFHIFHTQPPVFGLLCALQIEDRLNESNIAIHADITLTLNAEACKAMPGQLSHHITGGDLLYRHVGKFLRGKMPSTNETTDKAGSAVRRDLAFGAVAVAASIFDLPERFCTISGFQNPDRLGNDLHGHNLLHCFRQQ